MITIEKFTQSHVTAVLRVTLAEEQVRFAGTAAEFISDGSDSIHLQVIKFDNEVVGFFKIDMAYSTSNPFCPKGAIGLRAFVININQQSKGIGTHSVKALFPYLKQYYSSYDSIYLTVNGQNTGAQHCYLKGGFEDTDETYQGGAAGPQHIMQGKIT